MVIRITAAWLMCLCLLIAALPAAEIELIVDEERATANIPTPAYLRVTHTENEFIDPESLRMDGDSIVSEYMGQSRASSFTVINGQRAESHRLTSSFRFYLPAKDPGIHVAPSITIEVDSKVYRTPKVTYSITKAAEDPLFQLKAHVDSIMPVYPGQRLRFVYRIQARQSIEHTTQVLPLLEANGFRKIGSADQRSYQRGLDAVQEVSQEVEALAPGEYTFGPHIIEGYYFQQDWFGRKVYKKPRIRAEAETTIVTVSAFPNNGKPRTFTGAIGSYEISSHLLGNDVVGVGDRLQLEVLITGSGELSSIELPLLSRQDGFQTNFRLSDIAPVPEELPTGRRFVVELRPLSSEVLEIPRIGFGFFNVRTHSYEEVFSEPIPITVRELESIPAIVPTSAEPIDDLEIAADSESVPNAQLVVARIPIHGNYPIESVGDFASFTTSPRVLWLIPVGLLLVMAEVVFLRYREARASALTRTSRQLLDQACSGRLDPKLAFSLLEKSLLLRLSEKGIGKSNPTSLSVHKFLKKIEQERFSGLLDQLTPELVQQARELWEEI